MLLALFNNMIFMLIFFWRQELGNFCLMLVQLSAESDLVFLILLSFLYTNYSYNILAHLDFGPSHMGNETNISFHPQLNCDV